MSNALLETWAIADRLNRYLLADIADASLALKAGGKGRSVGATFAHIHNVRLLWLKSAGPELLPGLRKFEADEAVSKDALVESLTRSGEAISAMLNKSIAGDGRVKGFKPHVTAFVGYLVAHEAHHRGQIVMTLKLEGAPVGKKTAFGLWEWGVR
jgi:uncharacterized damage-inducible protein DinB